MGKNERDKSPQVHWRIETKLPITLSQFICAYEWNAFRIFVWSLGKNVILKFPSGIWFLEADKWISKTQLFIVHQMNHFALQIDLHENRDELRRQWHHNSCGTGTKNRECYGMNRLWSTINYQLLNDGKSIKELKGKLLFSQFACGLQEHSQNNEICTTITTTEAQNPSIYSKRFTWGWSIVALSTMPPLFIHTTTNRRRKLVYCFWQ